MDRPWKLAGTWKAVNKVRKVSVRNPVRWPASAYAHCTHWENEVIQMFGFRIWKCIFWFVCNSFYLKERGDLNIQPGVI